MWPGAGCEETVSDRGQFTKPSDLTSDLCDTRKTARIKSPRKSSSKLTCIKQGLQTKSVLAWAWLAKAKGHSCHTKKINPCQNIYGKNE